MKIREIKAALGALREIRMPRIEDAALRRDLIENHYTLLRAGRGAEAYIEDLRELLLGEHQGEMEAVEDLRLALQAAQDPGTRAKLAAEINGHKSYFDALRVFNRQVEDYMGTEIGGLRLIDRRAFQSEIERQDYKLSWVEDLYPLFRDDS